MFETKISLGSAKQKLFYILKVTGKPEKEPPSVSSPTAPYELTTLRANHCEAESKKAQALFYWQVSDHPM